MNTQPMKRVAAGITPEERWWWDNISDIIPDSCEALAGFRACHNSLLCPNCTESFQFGDIRIETPQRTIALEIEGKGQGASLTNLLKYWPWLEGRTLSSPTKAFTLIHIWGSSYPLNKELWKMLKDEFLTYRAFVVPAEFLAFPNGRTDLDLVKATIKRCLASVTV